MALVSAISRYQRVKNVKLVEWEKNECLVRGEFGNVYKVSINEEGYHCTCLDFHHLCKHIQFFKKIEESSYEEIEERLEKAKSCRSWINRCRQSKTCVRCKLCIGELDVGKYSTGSNYCYSCCAGYCSSCTPRKACVGCKKPFRPSINGEGYLNIFGLERSDFPIRQHVLSPYNVIKRFKARRKYFKTRQRKQ
mmetsp:Transcript_3879/g.4471  ORF Transcript_3879/g.4471 Transcript_3879/m.4471 type:complete len:193 (+) Transcript_3879:167-745(+)